MHGIILRKKLTEKLTRKIILEFRFHYRIECTLCKNSLLVPSHAPEFSHLFLYIASFNHKMDDVCKQLEEAIIYAYDTDSSSGSQERRNAAISLINDMRANPSSWKIAISTFLSSKNVGKRFWDDL